MKFSIKNLIVLIVFAALFTNWWVTHSRYSHLVAKAKALPIEIKDLKSQLSTINQLANENEMLEESCNHLSRSVAGIKSGKAQLVEFFEANSDNQSQIKIDNDQFSIIEIPVVDEHYRRSYRVHTPPDKKLSACIRFSDSQDPQLSKSSSLPSGKFKNPTAFAFPLPGGESVITLTSSPKANGNKSNFPWCVTVELNDQLQKSWDRTKNAGHIEKPADLRSQLNIEDVDEFQVLSYRPLGFSKQIGLIITKSHP